MTEPKTKPAAEKSAKSHEKKSSQCHAMSTEPGDEVRGFLKLVTTHKRRGAILDLGCGDGKNAIFFARHGFEGHGVDSHSDSIKRARANASRTGVSESTHFRVGNVFQLPYPEHFFDLAIDYGCLHHIHKNEWDKYLESVLRVMKPDAFFLLTVYSLRDKHVPGRKRQYVVHQGHYDYFFSKKEIRELFDKHFDIVDIVEEAIVTPDGLRHAFYHTSMRRKFTPEDLY